MFVGQAFFSGHVPADRTLPLSPENTICAVANDRKLETSLCSFSFARNTLFGRINSPLHQRQPRFQVHSLLASRRFLVRRAAIQVMPTATAIRPKAMPTRLM